MVRWIGVFANYQDTKIYLERIALEKLMEVVDC